MNLGDLANLGQIIGAAAVVISLFYVAHQIRQNTNAVRSATAQAVHEQLRELVTCPAVIGPLPWTLKVRKRAAGSVTVRPFPVAANACKAVVTFSVMALPSRRSLRSQMTPETAVAALRAVVLHGPAAPVVAGFVRAVPGK